MPDPKPILFDFTEREFERVLCPNFVSFVAFCVIFRTPCDFHVARGPVVFLAHIAFIAPKPGDYRFDVTMENAPEESVFHYAIHLGNCATPCLCALA